MRYDAGLIDERAAMRALFLLLAMTQASLLMGLTLNSEHQILLQKAAKANSELSYEEAIDCWSKILDEIEVSTEEARQFYTDLDYRIARANYELGIYPAVTDSYTPTTSAGHIVLALAYKNSGQPDKAIVILKPLEEQGQLSLEESWQLAHALYQTGDKKAATEAFDKFELESNIPRLYYLSQLYIARMEIEKGLGEAAAQRLKKLMQKMPPGESLHYELQFLTGEARFQQGQSLLAVKHFEQSLPKRNTEKVEWRTPTLKRLASCYLFIADQPQFCEKALAKAFDIIQTLPEDEDSRLILARYYVIRGNRLRDTEALAIADKLLAEAETSASEDYLAEALLLRAEAADSYQERDALLCQLTEKSSSDSAAYALGWFHRAANEMNEGMWETAARYYCRAVDLFTSTNPTMAARAARLAVRCYEEVDYDRALQETITLLQRVIYQYPAVVDSSEAPDELYYLLGKLSENEQPLLTLITEYPAGRFADQALYLLGTYQYSAGQYAAAYHYFERLRQEYPHSNSAGDACYWQARCVHDNLTVQRLLLETAFTQYADSSMAGEAYYSYYSPTEYLQGDIEALRHLEAMSTRFPNSPYVIHALLMTGLDYKRTRFTPEGQILRKRNWIKAIDNLEQAEAAFDRLNNQKLIPAHELDLFITARYRAMLERALANLSISTESEGAKKHIYLEYAVEMFDKLVCELQDPSHPLGSIATQGESFSPLLEEAYYYLALSYVEMGNDRMAKTVLDDMAERYHKAKIGSGYYPSRLWYQQAKLSMRSQKPEQALFQLNLSEEMAKNNVLGTEEKLDLWLQRSDCYRQLQQLDNAMLELSRVINDDAISSQRLQAMYLRSEIYELQGRSELAQKQLMALSQKGGRWAQMAKEKLDRDYRYD